MKKHIGMKLNIIFTASVLVMSIFATEIPDHMPTAGGEVQFNGIVITIDDKTSQTMSIERINM